MNALNLHSLMTQRRLLLKHNSGAPLKSKIKTVEAKCFSKMEEKKPSPKGLHNVYKFVVFGTASDIARSILYKLDIIKGALSGLKQFLVNESPLEMMKNAFYITLKALFVLKIFKFLS